MGDPDHIGTGVGYARTTSFRQKTNVVAVYAWI
jgi:hypothetical protein